MPRAYPSEFRARAVALVRVGNPISHVAAQLGISEGGLHRWVRQDQINRGERPGLTTPESTELAKARKRIRQLETEVEILKREWCSCITFAEPFAGASVDAADARADAQLPQATEAA